MRHSLRLIASSLLLALCCTWAGAQSPLRELHPILPYIFFDSGSAVIPGRYALLQSAQEASAFNEANLPSNSLEIHHRLLDVVGSRMRRFPTTRIEIVGCNSKQPEIGEVIEVSKKRGEAVRDYLVRIWGIDSGRIMMLPPRDYPQYRSNVRDPHRIVENRRAEIRTINWELMMPLITRDSSIDPELADSTVNKYNLILFESYGTEMGPINDRIVKEYIVSELRKGANVDVTGYTDVVYENYSHSEAVNRPMTVEMAIKRYVKPGIISFLSGRGVAVDAPIHSNEFPEGHFYNRCVQIIVITPPR